VGLGNNSTIHGLAGPLAKGQNLQLQYLPTSSLDDYVMGLDAAKTAATENDAEK